jgi:hypothetical protein
MSNDLPRMPDPVENNSFIPTLDRQGAIWLYIDEITQDYLDFAGKTKGTLLEVAAGDEWPGFIADVGSCIPEYLHPETFPKNNELHGSNCAKAGNEPSGV